MSDLSPRDVLHLLLFHLQIERKQKIDWTDIPRHMIGKLEQLLHSHSDWLNNNRPILLHQKVDLQSGHNNQSNFRVTRQQEW